VTALRLLKAGAVHKGVRVAVPSLDGGPDAELTADFRWLPADKARQAMDAGDAEFLRAVLAGWEGIEAPDGSPLPYGEAAIEALAATAHVTVALSRAYTSWLRGARAKNSPG